MPDPFISDYVSSGVTETAPAGTTPKVKAGPDPFTSDYVSSGVTETAPTGTTPKVKTGIVQTGGAIEPPVKEPEVKTYGFEPKRYGLGKPRRIVIRGKIAIE